MPEHTAPSHVIGKPTFEVIETLIRHDTTSRESNVALIDAIADFCASHGLAVVRQPSPDGAKENLLITVPDSSGRDDGGIMLAGHLDTVPVDEQTWSSDPFVASVRGHRIHGRGTADMKAFCGTVLAWLPRLIAHPLTEPLHVALTYDEETGCEGARRLVELLAARGISPRIAIVGEPTMMAPIRGHKGCHRSTLTFHGVSAHSSRAPEAVNAVEYAGRAVAFLADLAARFRSAGPFAPSFTFPHTTISVGPIAGGAEPNIVPHRCTLQYEIRPVPGHDIEDIDREIREHLRTMQAAMAATHAEAGWTLERTVDVPALAPVDDGPASALLAQLSADPRGSTFVSYGTEAGIYQAAGMDAVVCGPGSIDQAHIADEYVDIEQIVALEAILDDLARILHGGAVAAPS